METSPLRAYRTSRLSTAQVSYERLLVARVFVTAATKLSDPLPTPRRALRDRAGSAWHQRHGGTVPPARAARRPRPPILPRQAPGPPVVARTLRPPCGRCRRRCPPLA